MRACVTILLVFVVVCILSISSGMAVAGEYVAKQGDTWAKAAKATGNTVSELAKMNKVKAPKDSDPVPAGQKIVFLSKDDVECALKWCKKRRGELSYGTGDFTKVLQALTDLKNKRIEYSPDDPYPYGIRFTEILGYAKSWRGSR